jgi:hypothetical protein
MEACAMPSVYEFFEMLDRLKDRFGWGWAVSALLVIGFAFGTVWFYRRRYRPLVEQVAAAQGVAFFENHHALNKAIGSLAAELESGRDIYAVWPAGGSARKCQYASVEKHQKAHCA